MCPYRRCRISVREIAKQSCAAGVERRSTDGEPAMRVPTPGASRADGAYGARVPNDDRAAGVPVFLFGAFAAAVLVSLVCPAPARAGPQVPQFVDINPDDSGPKPGCAAPCASGGSGGRVHRLASSRARPNEIYAASELGGLFKGTFQANPGDIVWSHLDAFLPTKAWDVAIDPDGERVYATSFYDGRVNSLAGIQVSGDRGQTWTRPLTATPPALFCDQLRLDQPSGFGISIRPGSAKEILVGTNCGLARSVDFGVTWEFINPSSAGGPALSVWAVAALRGGRTYACGESGVMRSPDGRTGWVTLPDPSGTTTPYRYCSIAADSDFPDAVFVVFSRTTFFDPIFDIRNSTYFASFDGGNTWVAMPHPDDPDPQKRVPMVTTNRRSYGLDVWVGAGNLWRIPCTPIICPVTVRSLWRGTFSDGQGDRQKAHGDTGNVLFAPARSMDACPLFYSSDGGVYFNKNHNSRVTDCHDPVFLSANVGLHAQLLLGMAGAHRPGSQGEDVYMALQDDGLFATRHAGAPNRMWNHGGTADVFDVVADDTQAIVIDQGDVSWGEPGFINPLKVPNTPLPAASLRFFGVFTDDVDQFAPSSYVLAAAVTIPRQFDPIPDVLFTTNLTEANVKNGTVAWTSLGWPSTLAGIPCGVKAGRFARVVRGTAVVRVYAMSGDCLWRSPNQLWTTILGSNAWRRIDVSSACPNGGFGIFAVDRARPNRVYASCTGGTNDPRMLRSEDSGDTWQVDHNLTDLMTGPGIFVPRFVNPEDGATFGGVQPVMVAFDPHDDNILVAGGYESGVFISSDGGKAWSLLTDPFTPASSKVPHLPRPFYAHFDHEAGGPLRALYIGSVGRGVWRIELAETDVHLDEKIRQAACLPPCLPRPCLTCEVIKGQELELEFHVINAGAGVAGNPVFRLSLPEGLTFRSLAAPRSWQCQTPRVGASGDVRCALTSLGPGSNTTMTVRARVDANAGATLRTEASIVSNALDRNPENNRVTAANPVTVPTEREVR